MSDKRERLRAIFVEEAGEIIEDLDVKIINFEETPEDKDILNDIFRGIHTLKGSANSFGFTRLGEYVHHFEDVLDYYRTDGTEVSKDVIDLFLDSVDVVKEILQLEIDESDGFPEKYDETLSLIREIISNKDTNSVETKKIIDLGDEFSNESFDSVDSNIVVELDEPYMLAQCQNGEKLYKIELLFEDDSFTRGLDHANFLNILGQNGRILSTSLNFVNVPLLDSFEFRKNYIRNILIYIASSEQIEVFQDIFEFTEEQEWTLVEVEQGDKKEETVALEVETLKEVKEEAIVEKREKKEKKEETIKEEQKEEVKKTQPVKRSFVKIDTEKLDDLFDSVGELVISQNFLMENEAVRQLEDVDLKRNLETLYKITRLIQTRVMGLRMVPIRDTFEKMKRVVRDVNKKTGKDADLILSGEDTEIDKTMIDKLADPLIHVIRNALDHGLEADKDQRINAGKSATGKVHLKAYHQGGNIVIEVRDDGRGIDPKKILTKAIERELVTEAEGANLTDKQIFQFIMHAGFSTAEKVTDLSGRGVGLDVVKSFLETMRGKVEINSKMGAGSSFKIMLPLTLAIIDGMLVRTSGEIMIIPTLSIVESFRPLKNSIHTAKGEGEYVKLRDELLPIVRLNHILDISDESVEISEATLVSVENKNGKFAILVDELIGRQQVVVKSLGKALAGIKEVTGGAVLGNGDIALILNVDELHTDMV